MLKRIADMGGYILANTYTISVSKVALSDWVTEATFNNKEMNYKDIMPERYNHLLHHKTFSGNATLVFSNTVQ